MPAIPAVAMPDEGARLACLRDLHVLDTLPEPVFDDIVRLASLICRTPIGMVSLVDADRQWFKARVGVAEPETHRDLAFCAHAIVSAEPVFVVPDAAGDPCFAGNPFVTGEPYLKFYCGIPLINGEGYALGTICIMDFEPRQPTFEQITSLRSLSHQVMAQLELRRKLIEFDQTIKDLHQARGEVAAEKARTEELLYNILPVSVAEELKSSGRVQPKYAASTTILFADFKGFTLLAERMEPVALIGLLDQYFTAFDEIMARHGLEKLKTIGDAYMATAGVTEPSRRHAIDACLAALAMQGAVAQLKARREKMRLPVLELRIGVHSGPVMSGVVGRKKFTFDIWGDAVNTAALMETKGEAGRINISDAVAGQVKTLFDLEPRGTIEAKHGRRLDMYFLNRLKPELSRDAAGLEPNEKFAQECARLITGFSA